MRREGADNSNRCELDSHADTTVAGRNCRLFSETGKTVFVSPFSESYDPIPGIPIGSAAMRWTNPENGEPLLLVFNEALFFGQKMQNTLLCPNQLRSNGVVVNGTPRQFDAASPHSISVRDPSDEEKTITIPLKLVGVISCFDSVYPTDDEMNSLRRVHLTDENVWDPYSSLFADQEEAIEARDEPQEDELRSVSAERRDEITVCSLESERNLYDRLVSAVRVTRDDVHGYDSVRSVCALKTSGNKSVLSPEILAKRFGCGLKTAARTLEVTTQRGVRKTPHPPERRMRTNMAQLRYDRKRLTIYSDTAFPGLQSIRKKSCAQIMTNGYGWDHFFPMASKSEAGDYLGTYVRETRIIPELLVTDNAGEEIGGAWNVNRKRYGIGQRYTLPYSPWQNRAEASIRELKKLMRRFKHRTQSPKRLWCFLGELCAAIRRKTAHEISHNDGRVPEETISGSMVDISEVAQFDWYQLCWVLCPDSKEKYLARWIGVASDIGGPMTFWVLPKTCRPHARFDVSPLSSDDLDQAATQTLIKELDESIKAKIGDQRSAVDVDADFADIFPPDIDEGADDYDDEPPVLIEPEAAMPEEEIDHDAYDGYLSAEIKLMRNGVESMGRVVSRKTDEDGKKTGKSNSNPLLDSREYDVEFIDGSTDAYTANIIAQSMFSQIDDEGHSFSIIQDITDHRKDGSAVPSDDKYYVDGTGRKRERRTTKGWFLNCDMKDGSSEWLPLKDLKESYPVQVAEYAVANKIAEEPAFNWWIKYVLKKRDRIISKVKSRYWKKMVKYGIKLPHSVKQALQFDRDSGTTFWRDAITKEMKNVMPAFQILEEGETPPIGYKHIDCHMIFDIKLEGLVRKARLVAGGHQTEVPKASVFSSVVSRDSVRILFTIAALNDLPILSCDVQSAYLHAPTTEKVMTKAGPEFGSQDEGKTVLIVRALYGLRSSGARWRDHMAATLREMNYVRSIGDPDVWMRAATKPDGSHYYEYVLVYVDDLLSISMKPMETMDSIKKRYPLKAGSLKEPDQYLGAEIKKWNIADSDDPTKTRWALSAEKYIKSVKRDIEARLDSYGMRFSTKAKTPFSSASYRPELDDTPELDDDKALWYMAIIGILRWCLELGRVDIICEISLLSSFLACPRVGHLEQALHVVAYLIQHQRSNLVMDDTEPDLSSLAEFQECDWSEYYPDAKEPTPQNMPEPRGKAVSTTCFVDSDHAGCRMTRRSQTCLFLFLNSAPVVWYSKRQTTVESSTFGSESIAMKTAMDHIQALRFKLRMFGVPIDGATRVLCDNEAVVRNTTASESTLKKKQTSVAYHRNRECVASKMALVGKVHTSMNIADLGTKVLPYPTRRKLLAMVTW